MRSIVPLLVVCCLVLAGVAARAADSVTLPNCLLSLKEEVQVPAQEAGVLMKIAVTEGQQVARGALLAQIDDTVPQAQYNVAMYKLRAAEKQATDTIDIEYAEAAYRYAGAKVVRDAAANAKTTGTVSQEVVDEHLLEREKFRLSIQKAKKDLDIAALQTKVSEAELQATDAKLKQNRIVAPSDVAGTTTDAPWQVVELSRHEKEWVQAGDPVLRLLRMDVLRVEGFVSSKLYMPSEIENRPVQVVVRLARDQQISFSGKVVFVKPVIQAGDQFLVRAEVQNRRQGNSWILSPGLSASMTIELK